MNSSIDKHAQQKQTRPPLPATLTEKDLTPAPHMKDYKKYDGDYALGFDLWYVANFGWVIPTLTIKNVSRHDTRHSQQRTYAVTLDGKVVRVGFGPHVTHQVTVHGRKSRAAVLAKFIELRTKGEADAGQIRDRISTRRAQTALRRGVSDPLGWLR
jgi:hypothetical protein